MARAPRSRAPLKRHAIRIKMNEPAIAAGVSSFVSKKELFALLEAYLDGNHLDGSPRRASLKATGYLAITIKVTTQASMSSYPLSTGDFMSPGGGQVSTRGGRAAAVLKAWGFERTLGTEEGRTSRASIGFMEQYVEFLNQVHANYGPIDHSMLMLFWMKKARDFFSSTPIELVVPSGRSLRHLVQTIIAAVRKRERETIGRTITGTVMQHMVGAKLELVLGHPIPHHKANQSDVQTGRGGDFEIGDCAIHVTTAPTERLIQKCVDNITAGVMPIVVTLYEKTKGAEDLIENVGRSGEIEVLDFEGFMVSNLLEMSKFENAGRRPSANKIIDRYNEIIETVEQDPGLKIDFKA